MTYPGRCPFATWRGPIANKTAGVLADPRGLVLHVQQGEEPGTDSWFHNPSSQASAHFGVAGDGSLDQWVDLHDAAWAEVAGNRSWVSVEIAGYSGQPASDAQVLTLGKLYAWLAETFGWPMTATDDPNGSGLGWHGMGGVKWGGHLDCPGDPIKQQRPQILHLAGWGSGTQEETIVATDSDRGGLVRLAYLSVFGDQPSPQEWGLGKIVLAQDADLDEFVEQIADSPAGQAARAKRNPQPHQAQ